jgi:Flp pilus assembly pilin Flp
MEKFLREEDGVTSLEYALVLVLVVMVCFIAVSVIGKIVLTMFGGLA